MQYAFYKARADRHRERKLSRYDASRFFCAQQTRVVLPFFFLFKSCFPRPFFFAERSRRPSHLLSKVPTHATTIFAKGRAINKQSWERHHGRRARGRTGSVRAVQAVPVTPKSCAHHVIFHTRIPSASSSSGIGGATMPAPRLFSSESGPDYEASVAAMLQKEFGEAAKVQVGQMFICLVALVLLLLLVGTLFVRVIA